MRDARAPPREGFARAEARHLVLSHILFRGGTAADLTADIEPSYRGTITAGEDLQSFANYGFPESHAWSFALIAYATAWLKTHYPTEFLLGILNAWPMGFYSPATLIHDAKRHGVEVRSPCMLHGQRMCTTEETADPRHPALRVGWRYVHGIGEKALDALEAAWNVRRFTSIEDVVRRSSLGRADALYLARADAFKGVYQSMLRRLAAGDIAGASTMITNPIRDQSVAIFNQLGAGLPAAIEELGIVREATMGSEYAELVVTRDKPGGQFAYRVYVIRDSDGVWRIDGM